jgi:hypothetical protein
VRTTRRALVALGLALVLHTPARGVAQEARAIPGAAYGAGPTKARLLGRDYRDLWLTPVRVPVLDLRSFAGGLTPVQRGGGRQTRSLRFRGADGMEYAFRSVDKVPALAQHPDLRGALLGDLIQDQVSSTVPAAGVAAAPLAAAAGLLTAEPRLFVMPDDPALGEFREEFAGMLGTLEARANGAEEGGPGFGGLTRIVSTETMLERLEEDPTESVDERTYLRVRLLDILLGDWDRHEDQWRWGRLERPSGAVWIPIPRDRDYAFADYDGALLRLARRAVPNAVRFRGDIGEIEGLVMNATALDRRLLAWLERAAWDSVATALQGRLTDAAIDAALLRLPPEHHALRGPELGRLLRERRERLPEAATAYYLHLARVVEIRNSDAAERAEIDRHPDGRVEVTVRSFPAPDGSAALTRRRVFDPAETREVRLFLRGGDDVALVRGTAARAVLVRVVGGGGEDDLTDASYVSARGRWTSLHDEGAADRLQGGRSTIVDRRPYTPPPRPIPSLIRIPPPDAGARGSVHPLAGYSTINGPTLGLGVTRTSYAFRRHPHASRLTADLRYAPRRSSFGLRAAGHFQSANPSLASTVHLTASGIDGMRFYGWGNASGDPEPGSHYLVGMERLAAGGELRLDLGRGLSLSAGPALQVSRPSVAAGTPLDRVRPPGWDGWAALGTAAIVELERTLPGPDLHARVVAGGSAHQPLHGGRDPYGDLRASASVELPLGPAWASARGGGRAAWGGYPFHEAAYLGGRGTLRGFPEWRFAGESMVHGTLESGVALGRLPLLLNWRTATFAFVDAGRVFLEGEDSRRWHSAPGVGVQLSALEYSFRLTYAHGPTGRVYVETRRSPLP